MVACHDHCEPQCGYTPVIYNFPCSPIIFNFQKVCLSAQCIENACDCKKGFVRNSLGKCVDISTCTKETSKCPENETFFRCGTACEPTCEKPGPRPCTRQCIVNVCQCSSGFVRNGYRCTELKECPKWTFCIHICDNKSLNFIFWEKPTNCQIE